MIPTWLIISQLLFGTPDSIDHVKWDYNNPAHVVILNRMDSIIDESNKRIWH